MRQDLPTGVVTLLFTDIEGSTRLLSELRGAYIDALAEHRRIIREAATAHGGMRRVSSRSWARVVRARPVLPRRLPAAAGAQRVRARPSPPPSAPMMPTN